MYALFRETTNNEWTIQTLEMFTEESDVHIWLKIERNVIFFSPEIKHILQMTFPPAATRDERGQSERETRCAGEEGTRSTPIDKAVTLRFRAD